MFTMISSTTVTARPPRGDDDFWRMRQLLVDTVPITPIGFNWDVRWLDGQRFYEKEVDTPRFCSGQSSFGKMLRVRWSRLYCRKARWELPICRCIRTIATWKRN